MASREGVRSSARLSGAAASAAPARPAEGGGRAAALERAAAAALRRERAARAAERTREVEDSPRVLRDKCRQLARVLSEAKHLVVYTGAGISTAADIPDYRGPRGVWTRLQRGEDVGRVDVSAARPTFTHMALTALWARGALKFVVSQNCDGLHVRAGLPRRALAELHGDMFAERCAACRRVYLRAFDTTERTARHAHRTARLCHACGRELRDSIVHFGERGRAAWPLNWAGALRHAAAADVVLCLGSSLKVLRRYPRLWRMHRAPRHRPALYIVNLQWTPKDAVAALKINARCDEVMAQVARRLRLRVPRYRPAADPLLAHAEPLAPPEAHTARRPPLARLLHARDDDDARSSYSLSSPSATDSDDELPLRRLADRLRPGPALTAVRVDLRGGQATILLRAEHAPAEPPPPEPPPQGGTAALRRFRMPHLNGFAARPDAAGSSGEEAKPEPLALAKVKKEDAEAGAEPGPVKPQPKPEAGVRPAPVKSEPKPEAGVWPTPVKSEPKPEAGVWPTPVKSEPKPEAGVWPTPVKVEPKAEATGAGEAECESAALAAALIRRALAVCRAELYPGLHTMLAPAAADECAWCRRRYAARRCLWYGPPRRTPLERRAWRRVRGAGPLLCACCPERADRPPAADPGAGAGWYGKGYRKGRRRR